MEEGITIKSLLHLSNDIELVDNNVAQEPPLKKRKNNRYQRRNFFYLRVSKINVLPLIILLHDSDNFTELLFQVRI